jgi:hypothetical protein
MLFTHGKKPGYSTTHAPICWMWNALAAEAQDIYNPEWMILLGDDVHVEPKGWPAVLAEFLKGRPSLACAALLDEADPGFPSFLAVHSKHLQVKIYVQG